MNEAYTFTRVKELSPKSVLDPQDALGEDLRQSMLERQAIEHHCVGRNFETIIFAQVTVPDRLRCLTAGEGCGAFSRQHVLKKVLSAAKK